MLQGNYYYWRGNKGDEAKAVDFLQQALEKDPEYALAWAKLARVYVWQGFIGDLPSDEAIVKSRDAAERALAIDPDCAEAYYARGNMFRLLAGDWTAALSDYERATALDPHGEIDESARGNALWIKTGLTGQSGDLIDYLRLALERNPLSMEAIVSLGEAQRLGGQLEESAAAYRKLLELNPDFSTARSGLGLTLLLMGDKAEALTITEKEPDEASRLAVLTSIYWAVGRRTESDSALRVLERGYADRNAFEIAGAHAYRGDADTAFAWLDRAFQQKMGSLANLKIDPLFQKLNGDPRFGALLRKAKLAG
jgi:tetratricopeptide (TPR) repeat protein